MFGFLNVYKPKGITSHDVVSRLRKITKIKQIGHTGTLDPFAVGVLPICIGKSTKLIEYLSDDKAYIATVQFGKNTDSYDIDGSVTGSFDKKITIEELEQSLNLFRGEISQMPPIYSAIKVNGKKLYEYARKGESVEISPRKVVIKTLQLLDFSQEDQCAKILVECSKGTYIRSLAYDIGKDLECGAYLSELERVKAGYFEMDESIKLDDIKTFEDVENNLINPIEKLKGYSTYKLNDTERKRVSHGMDITPNVSNITDIVFLLYNDKIYAVGQFRENRIYTKKVVAL